MIKTKSSGTNNGFFGKYGGMYVPEVLEEKLRYLHSQYLEHVFSKDFEEEYMYYLKHFVGRPSPLYEAKHLSRIIGSKIYLKREDLNHTGSHKINNTIGQILLAKRMGAHEVIAETGAGQHGVATATACALMGLKCKIFMGSVDEERQQMNARRIKLLGAELHLAPEGKGTLKDAVDAALMYYIQNPDAYYLLGSAVGPHPYPTMVRHFQSIIGKEIKRQLLEKEGRLPDYVLACIGGGSNAIGAFAEFLDEDVILLAGEGAGTKLEIGHTAATLTLGSEMVFQGARSLCLSTDSEDAAPSYSIAAGLDYPGIGAEHAYLKDSGRVQYHPVSDLEAIEAFKLLSECEGIIPAIESAHAIALAMKELKNRNALAVINLSGRGDKDVDRLH